LILLLLDASLVFEDGAGGDVSWGEHAVGGGGYVFRVGGFRVVALPLFEDGVGFGFVVFGGVENRGGGEAAFKDGGLGCSGSVCQCAGGFRRIA
jgi:hypothetical protein